MLLKGKKYACEVCVRGHRVSNCQHSARLLQHINKKGRPVSQCPHCRSLRKSHSAHTRCDCGEKPHTKANCGQAGEPQVCCCSHGARCTCSLKKEHNLDPVHESDHDKESFPSDLCRTPNTPRALTVQPDGNVKTVLTGNYRPIPISTTEAHNWGLPDVVSRAYSINGPSPARLAKRSVDNLAHTNTSDALHSESQDTNDFVSAKNEQRLVRSEQESPKLGANTILQQHNSLLSPNISDISGDYNFVPNLDGFSVTDHETPPFSAGLNTPLVDWSHYDGLDLNNANYGLSYCQPPSWLNFNSSDEPDHTPASTCGDLLEAEDFWALSDLPPLQQSFTSDQYKPNLDTP